MCGPVALLGAQGAVGTVALQGAVGPAARPNAMVEGMRKMLAGASGDPVPAKTRGGAAKRPATMVAAAAMGAPLKRPAAAGPARAKPTKPAAAGPASAKRAPATKGLPLGWRTQVSIRKTGKSAGVKDTYYHSPGGNMYRSLREALAVCGPVRR